MSGSWIHDGNFCLSLHKVCVVQAVLESQCWLGSGALGSRNPSSWICAHIGDQEQAWKLVQICKGEKEAEYRLWYIAKAWFGMLWGREKGQVAYLVDTMHVGCFKGFAVYLGLIKGSKHLQRELLAHVGPDTCDMQWNWRPYIILPCHIISNKVTLYKWFSLISEKSQREWMGRVWMQWRKKITARIQLWEEGYRLVFYCRVGNPCFK